MQRQAARSRYVLCLGMSSLASLLGLVNPVLAGVLVTRALKIFSLPVIAPVILGMAAVKILRILLRAKVATILGGNRRSPLIRLQNRVGKWLWWIEPALHAWGAAGLAMQKFLNSRLGVRLRHLWIAKNKKAGVASKGLALRLASFIIYTVTDTVVTTTAGVLFYFTRSYALTVLTALLPAVGAAPLYVKKHFHFKHIASLRRADKKTADLPK